MAKSDKKVARQVHELLLSAHPQPDDPSLTRAALFQSSASASPSLVKDQTFIAMRLQTAIARGSSAEEGERLLLDAVHAAEDWVVKVK